MRDVDILSYLALLAMISAPQATQRIPAVARKGRAGVPGSLRRAGPLSLERNTGFEGAAIQAFPIRKWEREMEYRLIKEVWAFAGNRIAIRFVYEFHDGTGAWFRAHGNEQWEFDERGLRKRREAIVNDVSIRESERLLPLEPGATPRAP